MWFCQSDRNEKILESNYSTTKEYYQAQIEFLNINYDDIVLPGYMYEDIITNSCDDNGTCETYGYWTSSPGVDYKAYGLYYGGVVHASYSVEREDYGGLRPVITLTKDFIS